MQISSVATTPDVMPDLGDIADAAEPSCGLKCKLFFMKLCSCCFPQPSLPGQVSHYRALDCMNELEACMELRGIILVIIRYNSQDKLSFFVLLG